MSPLMLYAYLLIQRPGEFNTILQSGRLIQEYVVDQNFKVDSERLNYHQLNQFKLRAADYTNL